MDTLQSVSWFLMFLMPVLCRNISHVHLICKVLLKPIELMQLNARRLRSPVGMETAALVRGWMFFQGITHEHLCLEHIQ